MIFERTPREEIGKRAAEAGAGLAAAAHAQALQHHGAVIHDSRQRLKDSHVFRMENLGGKAGRSEVDPMGSILVTGDVYGDQAVRALGAAIGKSQASNASTASDSSASKLSKTVGTLAKVAIAAALIGSGIGAGAAIPWALGLFQPPPPAMEMPVDKDTIGNIVIE